MPSDIHSQDLPSKEPPSILPMYVSTEAGLDEYNDAIGETSIGGDATSSTGYSRQEGSTYNRPGGSFGDYADQRPHEAIPRNHHDIMKLSEQFYNEIGLVKHMIDLMTDFTVQGIRVVHPQKSVERYYQNWFSKVNGADRSERFCANLYKFGNVIVKRRWAKLTKKTDKSIRKTKAEIANAKNPTENIIFEDAKTRRGMIPSRYIFLNPSTIEVIGGDMAKFVGGKSVTYGLKIPFSINSNNLEDPVVKELASKIPADIKKAINSSSRVVPLNPEDTIVDHYKKEDWQVWAKPIMYGVFKPIRLLEKLQLTDFTALDGAVDRVRIFKLGDIDAKIMPTRAAFSKLTALLKINPGAGTRNIVWGPDIKMEESNSEVSAFLGEDKYKPTMNAIYGGLGIPPSLTGAAGIGGTTNNLVSLKSLIRRLEYVRQKLIKFWEYEFELVRQSKKFKSMPPRLEFDQNNLGDEEAEKKLFIDLADRDIVPYEFVQRKFGLDPESSTAKVSQEWKARDKKKMAEKAGPFHRAQFDDDIKKKLIDKGEVTPSEVGVDLLPRKPGETTNLAVEPEGPSGPGTPGEKPSPQDKPPNPNAGGRPPQSRDKVPRKKKRFTPVEKADYIGENITTKAVDDKVTDFWAKSAQEKIAEILNPVILTSFKKKNMRSLTAEQTDFSEKVKFAALFSLTPMEGVDISRVKWVFSGEFPSEKFTEYLEYINLVEGSLGRPLTFEEKHSLQREVYCGKN